MLDPFAGVGGTLLGAAICRTPRRALGFEIEPRWAAIYEQVVREALAERDGRAAELARPGHVRSGWSTDLRPVRLPSCVVAMPCPPAGAWPTASVDFVATDPPYNPQLRITMSGGPARARTRQPPDRLRHGHGLARRPRQQRRATTSTSTRMEAVFGELRRVLRDRRYAAVIVRDAYQDGRYRFTAADLAARASGAGFVPKGDLIWYQAGTRLRPYGYPRELRAQHRPPAHPRPARRVTCPWAHPGNRRHGPRVIRR